jgi:hypothetical protein
MLYFLLFFIFYFLKNTAGGDAWLASPHVGFYILASKLNIFSSTSIAAA